MLDNKDPWSMTLRELVIAAKQVGAGTTKLTIKDGDTPKFSIVVICAAVPEMLAAIEAAEKELGIGE